jgi:CRISPR-associated protein Cas1
VRAGASRVVDVSEHGRRVALDSGFLVVHGDTGELGRVPLDDVSAVLLSAYGTSCTTPLVAALAERGAILVVCGRNHLPAAWALPVAGHHAQTRLCAAQVGASKPLNKRLWRYIIQAKIGAQADVLEARGRSRVLLDGLVRLVRSGDPMNVEARAAQLYWPALFGASFKRDRGAEGVNAVLNYGYTVLRAACARATVAAGLHPSVSVKHRRDPLALVDDLMEPFRPVVDGCAARLAGEGRAQVTREARAELVELVGGLDLGLVRHAQSIATAYVTGRCPVWRRADVVAGTVRHADNDRVGTQSGGEVQERPSGPRLREDAAVGVCTEVPGIDIDDDD